MHPSGVEVWVRILVAAVLSVLYAGRRPMLRAHLLAAALDEAPDGVQIVALDGVVAYSNRSVEQIYGFSPHELRGKHVNDMNADPTFATRVILPQLLGAGRWEGELEVKHRDGSTFPIWLTSALVRDSGGRPVATVGVIRDVSERKRREEELRRYAGGLEEATRMKELFADILRHDLLGPASAMRLSIDALVRQERDPAAAKLLANASRSCARLTDLIDGASRYARLSAPMQLRFEPLDLGKVVEGVVADFGPHIAERGAHVRFEPHGPYPARANPIVAEVFANLLSNALKYGPAGGTIAVQIRDAGDRWDSSVADSGEGIRDEDKERVFTRFERLRKEGVKGTGVGLAIARRIVELHGGRIWVEDNPGGGSVFHVSLPKA